MQHKNLWEILSVSHAAFIGGMGAALLFWATEMPERWVHDRMRLVNVSLDISCIMGRRVTLPRKWKPIINEH